MPRDPIETTHVGSLPRPADVTELIFAKEAGQPVDEARFEQTIGAAVDACVTRQRQVGVTFPSDGEMSKISYATYIKDRLTGFEGDSRRRTPVDLKDFPTFLQRRKQDGAPSYKRPQCVGPIAVKDTAPLQSDIAHLQSAMAKAGYEQGFMNSASPGVIALFQPSIYHERHEDYLADVGEAMRHEYEAIVASGLILQLDSPDLGVGRHMMFPELSDEAYLANAELHVEALNHALRNIPAERVRLHICWGNYEGPHHCDIPLAKLLPTVLKAKPQALLFENANPRHGHEWRMWQETPPPDDKVLIPGVIDTTTNFIEHPDLVAERIERFVNIVGRERVIAGTDCGFSTFAGHGEVDAEIAWAKLESLTQGAEIAGRRA